MRLPPRLQASRHWKRASPGDDRFVVCLLYVFLAICWDPLVNHLVDICWCNFSFMLFFFVFFSTYWMHDFTCYMEDVFTLELYIHLPKWKQRVGDVKSNLGTVLSNWGNPVERNIWPAFIIHYSCLQTYWCLQLVWCFRILISLPYTAVNEISPQRCRQEFAVPLVGIERYWFDYRKQRRKGKWLHQDVAVGSQLKSSWLLEPIEIITSSKQEVFQSAVTFDK